MTVEVFKAKAPEPRRISDDLSRRTSHPHELNFIGVLLFISLAIKLVGSLSFLDCYPLFERKIAFAYINNAIITTQDFHANFYVPNCRASLKLPSQGPQI